MIQFCLEMGLFFSGVFSKDMQAQYWIVTFALVKLAKLYSNKPVTRMYFLYGVFRNFLVLNRQ